MSAPVCLITIISDEDDDTHTPAAEKKFTPVLPLTTEIVGRHEVVFYSDDRQLLDHLSMFLGTALNAGNAAIVVATTAHRESLMQSLCAYGVDKAAAVEQGRYIAMDAADMISTLVVNGILEPDGFLKSFGQLIQQAANAAQGKHLRVAIFGEGVDLLCKTRQYCSRNSR